MHQVVLLKDYLTKTFWSRPKPNYQLRKNEIINSRLERTSYNLIKCRLANHASGTESHEPLPVHQVDQNNRNLNNCRHRPGKVR